MKKPYNTTLEKRLVKAVTSGGLKGQTLLSMLSDQHFWTGPGQEAFRRIRRLVERRGTVIEWQDLLDDASLSDDTRNSLRAFDEPAPLLTDDRIRRMFDNADKYRQMRAMIRLYEEFGQTLDSDDLDVDAAAVMLMERFAEIRSHKNGVKLTTLGEGDNASDDVKTLLRGEAIHTIPTGFNTYDSVNAGFIVGSYVQLAAGTGSGKSAVAKTIATNMALAGAKVAFVPLEMKNIGVLSRVLSQESKVPMTKFLAPKRRMTQRERQDVYDDYRTLSKDIEDRGGKLTFVEFEEDIGIEDLLLYLKPLGYNVVFIDYIALLEGATADNQALMLNRMTRYCVRWAAANDAVVVGAMQLSDDGVVRYSRATQEHAALQWNWHYSPANAETKSIHIYQPKSRQQEPFDFYLHFDPTVMTVRDLTREELHDLRGTVGEDGRNPRSSGRPQKKDDGGKPSVSVQKRKARYFDNLGSD